MGLGLAVFGAAAYFFLLPSQQLSLFPATAQGGGDVVVSVSEAYVTQQARMRMPQLGMGNMQNLVIKMHAPNRAEATMDFNITVFGVPVTIHPHAWIHFEMKQGRATVQVDQVDVSGFNVPQELVNQNMGNFKNVGEDALNNELKRGLANTDLHVSAIEATEGMLIFKLSR